MSGTIGYHASHEQFRPSDLLRYVQMAERAGFGAAMCSDHFFPWGEKQGDPRRGGPQSGFAWSWLGAAMATTSLPFGVVTVPGWRYHPAIMAQACATLGEMFPGRFWVSMGSGEQLNEHVVGERWPSKGERHARLEECVHVIRRLWSGERVTHFGRVRVEEAQLYTRPAEPPLIVGAALVPETAEWVAGWADAMVTVSGPREQMKDVVGAFRGAGGKRKPIYLQTQISYNPDERSALKHAHEQWGMVGFGGGVLGELRLPEQFDAAAEHVREEDVKGKVRVSSSLRELGDLLQEDLEMGFDGVWVHSVHLDQERFIEDFGREVLPRFKKDR